MRDFRMAITMDNFAAAVVRASKVEHHVSLVVDVETRWNAASLRELASALGAVAGMLEAQSPSVKS